MEEKTMVKHARTQSFWFGVTTALAVVLGLLLWGVIGGSVVMGNSGSTKTITKTGAAAVPAAPSVPTAPAQPKEIVIEAVSEDDWVKGDKNAKISIVEFSDTECPFCQRFHPTMDAIVEKFDGQVNWVYRHFPLEGLHKKAFAEAVATECAGAQGGNDAFWAYLDRIFEITPANDGLDPAKLPEIAQEIGLNVATFNTCLESGAYDEKIRDQIAQATAAGGSGTPYSVILFGDEKIPVNGALPQAQLEAMLTPLLDE